MRFAFDGAARVGGGVPIFSRAAAFTAEAVLNGFGLRGFEGIGRYGSNQGNLSSIRVMRRVSLAQLSPAQIRKWRNRDLEEVSPAEEAGKKGEQQVRCARDHKS